MNNDVFDQWCRGASPAHKAAVAHAAVEAMTAWSQDLACETELADLAPWRRGPVCACFACMSSCAEAAGRVAAELEVLYGMWRHEPDPARA
jgi:hypothetical protein